MTAEPFLEHEPFVFVESLPFGVVYDGPLTRPKLMPAWVKNERWPSSIALTQAFIDQARPEFFTVGEGVVEFHVDNGDAIYEVLSVGAIWECRLLEGTVREGENG